MSKCDTLRSAQYSTQKGRVIALKGKDAPPVSQHVWNNLDQRRTFETHFFSLLVSFIWRLPAMREEAFLSNNSRTCKKILKPYFARHIRIKKVILEASSSSVGVGGKLSREGGKESLKIIIIAIRTTLHISANCPGGKTFFSKLFQRHLTSPWKKSCNDDERHLASFFRGEIKKWGKFKLKSGQEKKLSTVKILSHKAACQLKYVWEAKLIK